MSPVVRRYIRTMILAGLLGNAPLFFLLVRAWSTGKSSGMPLLLTAMGFSFLTSMAINFSFRRDAREMTKKWKLADGLLCPKCEYPLPLPVDGRCTCPECGHIDTEANIRVIWSTWGFLE